MRGLLTPFLVFLALRASSATLCCPYNYNAGEVRFPNHVSKKAILMTNQSGPAELHAVPGGGCRQGTPTLHDRCLWKAEQM